MTRVKLRKNQLLTLRAIESIEDNHDQQIVASMQVLYRVLSWEFNFVAGFIQKWIIRRAVKQLLAKGYITRLQRDSTEHYILTEIGQQLVQTSGVRNHRS